MLQELRNQGRIRKGGIVLSAALIAGTGVFFASSAYADPTPKAKCDSGDNRHFRARAHVEPSVEHHTKITGYSYKIWGDIGNQNDVDFELQRVFGYTVDGTQVSRDEVPETGSDNWVWVDLQPNVTLNPDRAFKIWGKGAFDLAGVPDPTCSDTSGYF